MIPSLSKLRDLLFVSPRIDEDVDRSSYERLALPYVFRPKLSFKEAVVLSLTAFLRIFLGSILFGFWGGYTLLAWHSIGSIVLRVPAVAGLGIAFVVLFGALMFSISAVARMFLHKKPQK